MKKMKKKDKQNEKMTIYEYEEKYSERQSRKKAARLLNLAIAAIGVVILTCMFSLFKDVYDFNEYVGYGAGVLLVAAFFAFFIVPVVKIKRQDAFEVNVTAASAGKAKRHNAKVRKDLAEKIIDCYANVDGGSWYGGENVNSLMAALKEDDNEMIKNALNDIYSTDVKRAAKDIIAKCAVKSGAYSAISQKDTADALLVAAINLQMIKDIVFLYGFRPSEAKLMRIFARVLTNSLVAYGLGNIRIGNGVVKTMGDIAKGIPILGSAISVLVDSSVQGLGNATLTAVIGRQTIKYLSKEYKLQNILDGIDVEETDEEFEETYEEVKTALIENKKRKAV